MLWVTEAGWLLKRAEEEVVFLLCSWKVCTARETRVCSVPITETSPP